MACGARMLLDSRSTDTALERMSVSVRCLGSDVGVCGVLQRGLVCFLVLVFLLVQPAGMLCTFGQFSTALVSYRGGGGGGLGGGTAGFGCRCAAALLSAKGTTMEDPGGGRRESVVWWMVLEMVAQSRMLLVRAASEAARAEGVGSELVHRIGLPPITEVSRQSLWMCVDACASSRLHVYLSSPPSLPSSVNFMVLSRAAGAAGSPFGGVGADMVVRSGVKLVLLREGLLWQVVCGRRVGMWDGEGLHTCEPHARPQRAPGV